MGHQISELRIRILVYIHELPIRPLLGNSHPRSCALSHGLYTTGRTDVFIRRTICCGSMNSPCTHALRWTTLPTMNADQLRPNDDQTMNTTLSRSNNAQAEDRPTVWTRTDDAKTAGRKRVTVAQAAELLGLSAEAVRSRVQRGTLESEKVSGTVYVLLEDPAQTRPNTDKAHPQDGTQRNLIGDQTEFIGSLQGQIEWLRREVERKDTLLMTLMQRVPELDPARDATPEPRYGPETTSTAPDRGTSQKDNVTQENPSWWRRFFSFE